MLVKIRRLLWGHRPADTRTIGASGAIFGILIANAILFPDRRIWLFPLPLTIPMRPFVAVMGAIEFFGTLGGGGGGVGPFFPLGGGLIGGVFFWPGEFFVPGGDVDGDLEDSPNPKDFSGSLTSTT